MSFKSLPPLQYTNTSLQRVYYLSMEYYMGRSLTNAMINLGIDSEVEEALFEVSEVNLQLGAKECLALSQT